MNDAQSDHAEIIAPPPLIYLATLVVSLLLEWLWPVRLFAWPLALALGTLLVLAGAAGVAWGLRAIRRAGTHPDPYKPTTAIASDGPYRFSRNPLYVAATVIYIGLAAALNALWPLVLLPVLIGVLQAGVIVREERYLERKFGADYLRYKRAVRRWL